MLAYLVLLLIKETKYRFLEKVLGLIRPYILEYTFSRILEALGIGIRLILAITFTLMQVSHFFEKAIAPLESIVLLGKAFNALEPIWPIL